MHKCQWENEFMIENHQKEVDRCFIQMTSKSNRNRTKDDLRKSRNGYPVTQVYKCGLMNWDWDHLHESGWRKFSYFLKIKLILIFFFLIFNV